MALRPVLAAPLLAALLAAHGAAITPINTSLATIPTGYFGGSPVASRPAYDIAALAQQRVIVIEKWEGPCWAGCIANSSQTPPVPCSPGCGEESYQLATLRRVKAANPSVSTVFYLNSLYDFPFCAPAAPRTPPSATWAQTSAPLCLAGTAGLQLPTPAAPRSPCGPCTHKQTLPADNLTAAFGAADLHMRDVHGQIIGLQNDNVSATTHPPARLLPDVLRCRQGMLHIPIFDFSKPAAVTLFLDFHRRLIAQGLVDGTFSDKPNERAFQNASNSLWYICENPHGPSPQHSWAEGRCLR